MSIANEGWYFGGWEKAPKHCRKANTRDCKIDLLGGFVLHFQPTGVDTYDVTRVPVLPTCSPDVYPEIATTSRIGYGCSATGPGSYYEKFTTTSGSSSAGTTGGSGSDICAQSGVEKAKYPQAN